jgi:translocation and assembly module TamB
MDWKAHIKMVSRVFAASALAFLIVSTILFGLVQTNWGVKELAGWVSRLDGELTFVAGRVSGVFPFRFALEGLSISDAKGTWLEAKGIKVRWSPLPLIEGRIYFKELVASSVNFDRLPALGNGNDGAFPSWVFALRSDRFVIDRLDAAKGLLGEHAVLKLDSRIPLPSIDRDDVEAFLRIERIDKVSSLLQAKVTLQAETRFLRVDISFHEDRDGLFSRTLGVEGPLSLALSGQGTPDSWEGKLLTAVLPFGRLAADLEVKDAKNPLVKMRGRLHPTPETMPPLLRMWMDRELPFELETRLRWPKVLTVDRFALKARELDLVLKGTFELNPWSSTGQFSLICHDLKPLAEILDLPTAGRLAAQGTVSTKDKILHFSVTGSAEDFHVGNSERVLGRDMSWEFHGEGSPAQVLSIKQMKIGAENFLLEGCGEMRVPEAAAAMDALFEIKDLQALSSLEFLAGWSTQGRANASWDLASSTLSSRFQGKLRPPAGVTPPFLAKEVDYTGTLSLENGATLNLARLEMVTPWGKLQGEGKAHFPKESLEASWHLLVPDLDPFSAGLKGGPVEVRGTLRGPLSALTLSADAAVRGLSVSGFHFDTGHATLRSESGTVTKGTVKADAEVKELALRGRADFDLSNQHLNLRRILLEGGKSTLSGALSLFLDTALAEGELKAECNDLSALSPLLHEKVQGSALVQARLFPSEGGQKASLLMDAKNLEFAFGKALQSRMEAHGSLLEKVPRGRMTLAIQNGISGDLSLTSADLILEGDLGKANFHLAAEGSYKDPFELKGSGLLMISSAEERMTLNHLEGTYGGTPLSLLHPAAVTRSSESIALDEWLFKLGAGQIQGSGYVRSTDLSLDLQFDSIPLQLIPVQEIRPLGGLARGNARINGSPATPEGTATLQIESLMFQDQSLTPAALTIHAALRDDLLRATVLVQGLSNTSLRAHVRAPFPFSISPLMLATSSQGEIAGSVKGEIDLEQIGRLLHAHEQRLSGLIELNLDLDGSWDRPGAHGEIRLRNGSYENLLTGTIVRDIEVDVAARTPVLVVSRATASDGERGRFSAQGQLELSPWQGFPFKLDLAMEKAKPFRYDWASATLGGDLTLTGSFTEALLTGRIQVDTAEFRIPDRLAPEIQNLEVVEINKPGQPQRAEVEVRALRLWPLSLDLIVESPGRVLLSGRGLDSEWQGEVRIKGAATQPSLAGALSIVRGSVNFLGKRFELKKGSLFLDGSSPPSPRIDVEAEAKSRDIVATLHLSGPVQHLEMRLSSDPPFPQDEILSRLLFGRSASNITPLQALQLADSINTLARGGGLDLLSQTRQMLGLDQLTLKPSGKTQEETALSAGKYLSEEVYLEMEQGISPETGKASLKWEITPNVSVHTEVGVNAEAGVGVDWRWDY